MELTNEHWKERIEQAREDGYELGYEAGREDGYEDGYYEARADAQYEIDSLDAKIDALKSRISELEDQSKVTTN
jgi:flagellar biosynthesis/type III secretory pathway protein FliH